jgi:hypothetical protein
MRKHWLRGVVLGVTLAVLLAGAVTLAAGITVATDQQCFECYPGEDGPPEEYVVRLTVTGFDPEERMVHWVEVNGEHLVSWVDSPPLAEQRWSITVRCSRGLHLWRGHGLSPTTEATPASLEDLLGEWSWLANQPEAALSGEAVFLLAEDCAAYEFVPEPGTLMLLGSGLAGLAGYAALRWRTRG